MNKKHFNVFFFGDSVCSGQGVAIHKGWVTRMSACLSELGQQYGHDVVVINASVNGNTTRQALERMPYDIQSHEIDIIIVQFGLNDCNFWLTDRGHPRVSPEAFQANLKEIIQRALTFRARGVFLNTNHPTGRDDEIMPNTNSTYQENNVRYNDIIRTVAMSEPRVILNDVEVAFDQHIRSGQAKLLRLLLPDMLHLSEEGHNLYFDIVSPPILSNAEILLKNDG